jgi:hypothetical protein
MGYQRGDLIYYKLTDMSLDNGLVPLKTDADVLKMVMLIRQRSLLYYIQ